MKALVLAIAATGLLSCGTCLAQSTQSGTVSSTVSNTAKSAADSAGQASNAVAINSNPAVATNSASDAEPVAGSNSFTMNEAKARLERHGFTNVDGLSKDSNGIWRGKADKAGAMTTVWLDYKGNIGTGK